MNFFSAFVERDSDTGLFVRSAICPDFLTQSQASSLEEFNDNLRDVIEIVFEGGEPVLEDDLLETHASWSHAYGQGPLPRSRTDDSPLHSLT